MKAAAVVTTSKLSPEAVVGCFSESSLRRAAASAKACAGVRLDALVCSQRSGQNLSGFGEKCSGLRNNA